MFGGPRLYLQDCSRRSASNGHKNDFERGHIRRTVTAGRISHADSDGGACAGRRSDGLAWSRGRHHTERDLGLKALRRPEAGAQRPIVPEHARTGPKSLAEHRQGDALRISPHDRLGNGHVPVPRPDVGDGGRDRIDGSHGFVRLLYYFLAHSLLPCSAVRGTGLRGDMLRASRRTEAGA